MADSRFGMHPSWDPNAGPSILSWFRECTRKQATDYAHFRTLGRPAVQYEGIEAAKDGAARLNALADDLLQRALGASDDAVDGRANLRDAVSRVCDAAHTSEVRVEELLVVLKTRWQLAIAGVPPGGSALDARFARVITACIHEYYSPRYER